jgi:hypothetical protein
VAIGAPARDLAGAAFFFGVILRFWAGALALGFRAAGRFAFWRLTDARVDAVFRADFAARARRATFRFAMDLILSEP